MWKHKRTHFRLESIDLREEDNYIQSRDHERHIHEILTLHPALPRDGAWAGKVADTVVVEAPFWVATRERDQAFCDFFQSLTPSERNRYNFHATAATSTAIESLGYKPTSRNDLNALARPRNHPYGWGMSKGFATSALEGLRAQKKARVQSFWGAVEALPIEERKELLLEAIEATGLAFEYETKSSPVASSRPARVIGKPGKDGSLTSFVGEAFIASGKNEMSGSEIRDAVVILHPDVNVNSLMSAISILRKKGFLSVTTGPNGIYRYKMTPPKSEHDAE